MVWFLEFPLPPVVWAWGVRSVPPPPFGLEVVGTLSPLVVGGGWLHWVSPPLLWCGGGGFIEFKVSRA